MSSAPIIIATRGSPLALAQARHVAAVCQAAFRKLRFEIRVVQTTGDKMQTASLANADGSLPKGLFTKEIETELIESRADMAVHSLKDLPTELPEGLKLGAVTARADPRDVLIYRDAARLGAAKGAGAERPEWSPGAGAARRGFGPKFGLGTAPAGFCVATSSTRRQAQLRALAGGVKLVPIRGNVATRLRKFDDDPEMDGLILAAAGLGRLGYRITAGGTLKGEDIPDGLMAAYLDADVMVPCAGQAALGIEVRGADERLKPVCERLDHSNTRTCVTAERAFLRAMGGGCSSPIAAFADVLGHEVRLRVAVEVEGALKRFELRGLLRESSELLGQRLAEQVLRGGGS